MSSVFQGPEWRACVEALGYGSFELDGRLFFETRRGPFRCAGSPLRGTMTPYMGPRLETAEAERLVARLRERGFDWLELGLPEAEPAPTGAERVERRTQRVLLSADAAAMWDALDKRARNMARKAEKAGVGVRELDGTPAEADRFYEMLTSTFAKSGAAPPQPRAFYRELVTRLRPAGALTFLAAAHGGRDVAMGLFAHDAREVHFVSGAALPEAGPVAASTLLHWELMKRRGAAGTAVYDLGGLGIPSIDKFKKSFGGAEHAYGWFVWRSSVARACEAGYRLSRGVLAKARFLFGDA